MNNINYVFVYDDKRLSKLRHEITDILFEKGHTITKPMIDDIAMWAYKIEDKVNFVALTQTTSAEAGPTYLSATPPKSPIRKTK